MPITTKQMLEMMKSGAEGSNQYLEGNQKLAQLIKGKQLDEEIATREAEAAQKIADKYGGKRSVKIGGASIMNADQPIQMTLTPAQKSAEASAGKKIADYQSGGKQSMESNLSQLQNVSNELAGGKRDIYDRTVGGMLKGHPTLQGIFAPTEKARMDRVQNALTGILKETGIQRPTQWEVQTIFGQNYDPAASDELNIARMKDAITKSQAKKQAMEQEAANYQRSGYATIGVGSPPMSPAQPQAPAPQTAPPPSSGAKAPLSFEEWKKQNGR